MTIWLAASPAAGQTSGIWLDVPFVRQGKNECGAASLSMVMQYWARETKKSPGAEAAAATIQSALYSARAGGIYASDLQQYLRDHGFRTFAFHGGWDDLKQHLVKGRPLIVALGESRRPPLHYVVVTGLDWAQRVVLVNDPARRKLLKQDWREFEREWDAAGHWTLLAVPR